MRSIIIKGREYEVAILNRENIMDSLTEFEKDYVACMLFADLPKKHHLMFSFNDLAPCALAQCKEDCKAFQEKAGDLILDSDLHPGHDFWLTRMGHGAGFWDGNYKPKKRGEKLTKIAEEFNGELSPYVGKNDLIYIF